VIAAVGFPVTVGWAVTETIGLGASTLGTTAGLGTFTETVGFGTLTTALGTLTVTAGLGTLTTGLGTLTVTFGLGMLIVGRGMFGLGIVMTGFGISTALAGLGVPEAIRKKEKSSPMARRDKLRMATSLNQRSRKISKISIFQ
jgi:hypothetical protein